MFNPIVDITNTLANNLKIKSIEQLDEQFFNSKERKSKYDSKGKKSRTIITIHGKITYSRYSYVNKHTGKDHFYYIDELFNFDKYLVLDKKVQQELFYLCGKEISYSKSGQFLGNLIHKNCNIDDKFKAISRATIFNYCKNIKVKDNFETKHRKVKTIYVEADEHFISFQDGSKKMVKAVKIYSDFFIDKNGNRQYKDRFIILDNFKDNMWDRVFDYLVNVYDLDYVERVFVQGDGDNWIKKGKFYFDNKGIFILDKFHFKQALLRITTRLNKEEYHHLLKLILKDEREEFKNFIGEFVENNLHRKDTIIQNSNYILNNWNDILKIFEYESSCAMESCISHAVASIYTSRPKGFSEQSLVRRLHLMSLLLNTNSKEEFIKRLEVKNIKINNKHLDLSILDNRYKGDTSL